MELENLVEESLKFIPENFNIGEIKGDNYYELGKEHVATIDGPGTHMPCGYFTQKPAEIATTIVIETNMEVYEGIREIRR